MVQAIRRKLEPWLINYIFQYEAESLWEILVLAFWRGVVSCSTVRMMLTVSVHCGKQKKKVTNIDSMTTEMKFDERSDRSRKISRCTVPWLRVHARPRYQRLALHTKSTWSCMHARIDELVLCGAPTESESGRVRMRLPGVGGSSVASSESNFYTSILFII